MAPPQKTPPTSRIVRSEDIDDRIGRLIHEINEGRKEPDVRRIIAATLRGRKGGAGVWKVPPRAWRQEVNALYGTVIDNVRYTLDPHDLELFQSPSRTVQMGIGDCDDMVILLGALLRGAGYPCRIKVIGMAGSNEFSHVYLLAGLPPSQPTRWIALDPSREDHPPGWEFPPSKVGLKRVYEVDDQQGGNM